MSFSTASTLINFGIVLDIHGECRLSSYMLDILRITGPLTENQIEQFKDLSEIQETRQRIMDIKRNGREFFLQNSNNNRHKLALRSPRRFENNTERFENNTERFENSTETETDGDRLFKATAILKELLPKYFSRQYGNMKDKETQTENNTEKTVDMNKLKTLMEFAVEKIPDSSISNVKVFLDCCMGKLVNKNDEAMSFYCNRYTHDNNDLTDGSKNELFRNNTDIDEIWNSHRNSKYMIDDDYFETRMQSIITTTIDACNKRARSLGCKPSKDKIIVDYLNTRNRIAGEKMYYNQNKVSADVADSVDISNEKYTFDHEMERQGISLETTYNNNEEMFLNVMDDLRAANVSQSTTTLMSSTYGDKSSDREIFIEKAQTNKPFMIMKQNHQSDEEHIDIKPNESKSHPSTFSYYLPESAVPFNWARNGPDPCDDVVDDEYYREELVVPKLDLMFTRVEDVPISVHDTDSSFWSESQSSDRSFQMYLRSKSEDADKTGKTTEESSFNHSARPNVTSNLLVAPDFDLDESFEKIPECAVKPIKNLIDRIGYDSNTELREKRKRILESANTRILHEEKELDSNSVDVSSKTSNQEENAFKTFDLELLSPNTKTDMKRRILKSAKWVLAVVTYMETKKDLDDCKSLFQIENVNNDVVIRDTNSYENLSSSLTKSHSSNDQFGSQSLYESDKSSNSSQSRGRGYSFEKFDKPTETVFISSPSSLVHVSVSRSALQNEADNLAYNGQIRTKLEESTDCKELKMQSIKPQGQNSLYEHTNEDIIDNQPHISFSSESLSSDIIPNIISSVVETLQRDHANRMSDLTDDLSNESCSWNIPTIPPESPHNGLNTLCDTSTIKPEFHADGHMVTDPMTTEKLSNVKDASINNEKSLKRNESKKQNVVNLNYEIETPFYSDHKELPVHLKNGRLENNPNDQQNCYSVEVKSVSECLRTPLSTSDWPSVIQGIDKTEIRTISECPSTPSCRSDWASTESDFSEKVCQTGLFECSEKKNMTYDDVSVCKEEDGINNNRRNQNVDAFIPTKKIEDISNPLNKLDSDDLLLKSIETTDEPSYLSGSKMNNIAGHQSTEHENYFKIGQCDKEHYTDNYEINNFEDTSKKSDQSSTFSVFSNKPDIKHDVAGNMNICSLNSSPSGDTAPVDLVVSAANSETKMKNRHIDNEVFTVDEILKTKSYLSCLNKEHETHLDIDLVENIGPAGSKIKENTVNFDEASVKSNGSWDSDGSERQNLLNNDNASVTSCCSWDSNSEIDKDDSINMTASKHMQSLLESDSTKIQIHGNRQLEPLHEQNETKNIIADIKHIDQSTVRIPKMDALVGNELKTQLSNKDTYSKFEIPIDDEDVFLPKKCISTLHKCVPDEVLSNRHLNEELNRNKLENTEIAFEDIENLDGAIKTVGRNVLYRGALVIDDGGGDTTDDCSVIDMPKSELERWQESKNQSLQKCDEDQNIAIEQIQPCLFQRMIPDHKNNQNDKTISKSSIQALLPLRGTPMLNPTQKMSNAITSTKSFDYVYNSPHQMPSFKPLETTNIGKTLKRQGILAPLKPIQETIKQEKVKSPKKKENNRINVQKSKTKKKANKIKAQPVHQTKDVHENSSTETFSMPSFELADNFQLEINTQRDNHLRSNIQMDDDFIQNSPDSSESSCKRNFRDYMDKRKMDDDFAINSYESSDSENSGRNVNYNCNEDPTTGINVVVSQKRYRQKKAPLKSVIGKPPVCNNTFSIKSVNTAWTPDYRIWDPLRMVDGSVCQTFDYIGETKIQI
ncbi:unnamed protein product [Mytilus edulis]|uniref:Uncharacterized protein n=1 Tax=Mytilus edulis TaxID=6550 RepID=A0A8S3R3Q4_MYTED|nr:unnamed protein product [Mytilus edulis]